MSSGVTSEMSSRSDATCFSQRRVQQLTKEYRDSGKIPQLETPGREPYADVSDNPNRQSRQRPWARYERTYAGVTVYMDWYQNDRVRSDAADPIATDRLAVIVIVVTLYRRVFLRRQFRAVKPPLLRPGGENNHNNHHQRRHSTSTSRRAASACSSTRLRRPARTSSAAWTRPHAGRRSTPREYAASLTEVGEGPPAVVGTPPQEEAWWASRSAVVVRSVPAVTPFRHR